MRKRKLMTAMLAAVLAFSLAACGGEKKPADTTDTTDTSQTDTSQTDSSQTDSAQADSSQTDTSQTEVKQEVAEAETNIVGYSEIMKQTEFYGYVSSFLRLKINEGTNYDVYAITYVNDDELTDPVALAAAVKEMKDDPDTYYQKSLDLLEAMLTAVEFREPVEAWFE
mgnify:FL=1